LPANGYFEQLKNAKAALQATSSSDTQGKLVVAHKLLEIYERGGSASITYFAALDCIALGDLSHSTLRKAREAARSSGLLEDLLVQLQALPQTLPSKEVLLHTFLLATDVKNDALVRLALETLRDSWSGTYESNLAGAVHEYSQTLKQRTLTADDLTRPERMVIAVWKDARTAKCADMELAALEVAYDIHQKIKALGGGNSGKVPQHGRFFLELDPENLLGWRTLLAPALHPSGGSIDWVAVETMLNSHKNYTGYVTAGLRAQEMGELDRAERYFQTARQHESKTGGVTALVALTHLLQGQPNRTPEALTLVAKLTEVSPHLAPQARASIPGQSVLPSEATAQNNQPPSNTSSAFTPPPWNAIVRAQVQRALTATNIPLEEALSAECADYNSAKGYLTKGSDLLQQQQETMKCLQALHEQLNHLIQGGATIKAKQWTPIANMLLKTSAYGFEDGPQAYASALKLLEVAVKGIDPNGAILGDLVHFATVQQCADEIGRMRAQVSTLVERGYPAASVREAISKLADAVKTYQTTVWQVISPKIVDGGNMLKRWVDGVETLR
jgi:tetratricopeptide (TPR) repeat protein